MMKLCICTLQTNRMLELQSELNEKIDEANHMEVMMNAHKDTAQEQVEKIERLNEKLKEVRVKPLNNPTAFPVLMIGHTCYMHERYLISVFSVP